MASVASVPVYMLPGVPVVQPPHLEGDPSFATEILPGPPLLASIQQAAYKRPTASVSYLPTSDPGSTYTGWPTPGGTITSVDPDEPRRKRARTEKGRAHQPSTRALSAATATIPPPTQADDNSVASTSQDDAAVLLVGASKSTQSPPTDVDMSAPAENGVSQPSKRPKRTRVKGKEQAALVKVKDEPLAVSVSLFDNPRMSNDDHCSSCRTVASGGGLVYCDSCPRAFHLMCLNPPANSSDVSDGDWFCPCCIMAKAPPTRPPRGLFGPLMQHLDSMHPVEFQLPEDVRTFFKDVNTDSRGFYIDNSQIRHGRLDRHGLPEERDPYRLRDRNGTPVVCFRCGQSALPDASREPSEFKRPRRSANVRTAIAESGRALASCDYCDLYWHFDCLDPPMVTLPSFGKKWMCPAHADHVMPKTRAPRLNNPTVEITRAGQKYSGNLEIVDSGSSTPAFKRPETDDVVINGRRYRVPERVVILDFWSKLSRNGGNKDDDDISTVSSLTSLSSEAEDGGASAPVVPVASHYREELRVAQLLCDMKLGIAATLTRPDLASRASSDSSHNHAGSHLVSTEARSPALPQILSQESSHPPVANGAHGDPMLPSSSPTATATVAPSSYQSSPSDQARPSALLAEEAGPSVIAVARRRTNAETKTVSTGPATPPKPTANGDSHAPKTEPVSPPSIRLSPVRRSPNETVKTTPSSSLKIRLPARNVERSVTGTTIPAADDALPVLTSISAPGKASRPRRTARESASASASQPPGRSTRTRRKSTKSLQVESAEATI